MMTLLSLPLRWEVPRMKLLRRRADRVHGPRALLHASRPTCSTYDDEGYVTVRGQVIDVPADQVEAAREAAGSCPERAITLLED